MESVPDDRSVIASRSKIDNFEPRFEAALHYYITKRSVVSKPQSLIAAFVCLLLGCGMLGLPVEAQSPVVAPTQGGDSSETKISVPDDLQKIFSAGTVPTSLASIACV